MHVYLTARHLGLTDAIRDYVEQNLVEPIRKHGGAPIPRIEVQLFEESSHSQTFGCHVTLEMPHAEPISVRELGHDLYASIDLAKDRVLRALIEHNDRTLKNRRRADREAKSAG